MQVTRWPGGHKGGVRLIYFLDQGGSAWEWRSLAELNLKKFNCIQFMGWSEKENHEGSRMNTESNNNHIYLFSIYQKQCLIPRLDPEASG
jgi:hypothetical protein